MQSFHDFTVNPPPLSSVVAAAVVVVVVAVVVAGGVGYRPWWQMKWARPGSERSLNRV